MITVACVLRSGGHYSTEWVWRLRRGLNEHLTDYRFVCLSDIEGVGMWRIPLAHDWPGWWAKLELFRHNFGPTLYLDLDTIVTGDLAAIASYRGPFAMLTDFFVPRRGQSAVMAWTPGPHTYALYEDFHRHATDHMARLRGDQDWINERMPDAERLQELYPGQIAGLKGLDREVIPALPDGTRLLCAHGEPRLDDPAAGWAHKLWAA